MISRRATLAVAMALLAGLLSACGSAPAEEPAIKTVEVPGVAATVVVPAQWTSTLQGTDTSDELVIRSKTPTGDPAFRANVVVTSKTAENDLDTEGVAALAAATALPGWSPAEAGSGMIEVGGQPAFRITGTYKSADLTVVQTETIVAMTIGDAQTFVYLTSSVAPAGDQATEAQVAAHTAATAEAQSVIDGLTPVSK